MSELEVTPLSFHSSDLKKFIRAQVQIFQSLTQNFKWTAPLQLERLDFLNPHKNPFFQNAQAQLFIARRNGRPVGRISAQRNFLHEERYQDDVGFFGFFDCENNPETAAALINEAKNWLVAQGIKTMRGPMSFSINEEVGVLIDGFNHPPHYMMGQNPPYYSALLEDCGLVKTKDLYCWAYDATKPIPEPALQIAAEVLKHPGLVVRNIRMNDLRNELKIIFDIYNEAWSKNWGYIPMTKAEIDKTAKDMKLIVDPEMIFIAEVDGEPAGMCVFLPNLYEATADLNGSLFPFGIFKMLYRLKRRKLKSIRMVALGVRKKFRSSVLGGLSILFYTKAHEHGKNLGYDFGELSWTLEDNEKINAGIAFMGGTIYKTYRVYEQSLGELKPRSA